MNIKRIKVVQFLALLFNFGFIGSVFANNPCDYPEQKCAMSHPHFFFSGADLSFDTKLGYQKNVGFTGNGKLTLNTVNSGDFKGALNFTNNTPDNDSVPKNWVQNDILQTYYSKYTNPVSWDGDRMEKTNGGDSRPADLRYAVMISVLKVKDHSNSASYTCRNVVIARGDDNWWVFQNDGKRPKDGPGLYCYLDTTSSTNIQTYDISLLGGDDPVDIDGEEVYKMKIRIQKHEE